MTVGHVHRVLTICLALIAAPLAAAAPIPARPANSPSLWVTSDDYPSVALRGALEGATAFRLEIDGEGRVSKCVVTKSSGVPSLDEATCSALTARAQFAPARDAQGKAIAGSYASRVNWSAPKGGDGPWVSMASCAPDASAAIMVITPVGCMR